MAVIDLALFGPDGYLLSEASWGPAGVTGADKVAQRFLYALMLPVGTVPGRPNDGTDFYAAVATFRSEFDLFAAFSAAEPAAAQTVRECEGSDDPSSEKYGASRLAAISVGSGVVTLTFDVVAADGSSPTVRTDFTIDS